MKYKSRRKTIFSLMGALGIAASVFLYFQLFSVGMIDSHKRNVDKKSRNSDTAHLPIHVIDKSNIERDEQKEVDWKNPANENSKDCEYPDCDSNLDKDNKSKHKENDQIKVVKKIPGKTEDVAMVDTVLGGGLNMEVIKDLPRGAKRSLASVYKPDEHHMFTCLHSKERIPYSEVNDDYCDCADGTDEPGTAACTDNRFYCTFQGLEAHSIPSSRVNDGICDCCDGSDEWMNISVPEHVRLIDGANYNYHQAPCTSQCKQEIEQTKNIIKIHRQGAEMKKDYIKAAKGQSNTNMLYGTDGAFYALSKNCYEIKSDKYEYKICPFKEIRQQVFPEPSTLIGQVPEWVERGEEGHYTLRMGRGDSKQCPGLIKREGIIKFECGITDKALSIQETEVCQYTIHFTTPVAC